MKAYICLIGNDGTGKTTTMSLINSKNSNISAIERSSSSALFVRCPQLSIFDKLTMMHTFEDKFNDVDIINDIDGIPLYWVILDCDVPTILTRIRSRETSDIWETEKALMYFRNRFRQLGAHFGIPLIDTTRLSLEQVCRCVEEVVGNPFYRAYRSIGTKYLTYETICENDVETLVYASEKTVRENIVLQLPKYAEEFPNVDREKIYARAYVHSHAPVLYKGGLVHIGEYTFMRPTLFKLVDEGESKKVYIDVSGNPYTRGLVFICLKDTIYSHSKQSTATIDGLGEIRATGTQLFMEMLWRNGLSHAYRSINHHGIIVADWVDCPPLEIVVKRFCIGSDKHSFHDMISIPDCVISSTCDLDLDLADPNCQDIYLTENQQIGEYRCGPYMRTDWRNPNHVDARGNRLNANPFYYLFEECVGKESFFNIVLKNPDYAKPFGDRCVPEDIVCDTMDLEKTRKSVLCMFATIQSYFSKVGLFIKDVCFMLNKEGDVFWSEINQDCMRIGSEEGSDTFDKDLWRAGGSASKDQILAKWVQFNDIMKKYFAENRFDAEMVHYNEYHYQSAVREILNNCRLNIPPRLKATWNALNKSPVSRYCGRTSAKRLIFTLDMFNGAPVLVKSGGVSEIHSGGDPIRALDHISIYPDILVVDLNGALCTPSDNVYPPTPNRAIIKRFGVDKYIHTGGGLRTLDDIQDVLGSSVRRVVLGSASDELIQKVPRERLIVELTVNEENEVLIDGRKTNTHIDIFARLDALAALGVNAVSITFHQTEGHLNGIPRSQIRDLVLRVPRSIGKIIIAGGITTLNDLDFLWSFDRVIPQLGSAIWKGVLSVGEVIAQSMNYDANGLLPAIIQDVNGMMKSLVYMNKDAIQKTCEERVLWRFSRSENKMMKKGETSGNVQRVLSVSPDCDSDTMLITVDSAHPMCHTWNASCFPIQTVAKTSVAVLRDHLLSRMGSPSYVGTMQQKPALALAKVMEEFWEIVTAPKSAQIHEVADLFIHLLMYLNGIGIQFEDVLNELNSRRWDPHLVDMTPAYKRVKRDYIIIGITSAKYSYKTYNYIEKHLGIKIACNDDKNSRSLLVTGDIVDSEKYERYFGKRPFCFITARPKNMAWLMAAGRVDYIVTYETVIKNFPVVYKSLHEDIDPSISLCLLKRKGEHVDPSTWSIKNRVLIAAEHVCHVSAWMEKKGISSEFVHLDRVDGSSEGFLVSTNLYTLCDAVVESGETLKKNNLEIFDTIIPKGEVLMGLYERI